MKRSPRDMVWILLLAAVAFTGISTLSKRIHAAQSVGEADPLALITEPPKAVLCLHQPQTLQLMLPSLPAVQRLLRAYLPENPLCQPEQIGEWLPFTLVYYPEGEVWMAPLSERDAKQLWKRLDASHSFAAEEQTELTLPVRYYPERGKRFLGWKNNRGEFVQQVYCPTSDIDLYAVFVDVTDNDGITAATPLKLRDGESVKVRLTGMDKLYFMIDTAVKGDFIVNMKVGGVAVPNCVIYQVYYSSFANFSNVNKLFTYTPQTVLSLIPFYSGGATLVRPFEVELTVIAV